MIKSVAINNFMAHSNLEVKNIPSINLIIGKNDTGKTGLLKLLYATIKSLEIYSKKAKNSDPIFARELADKMLHTFMPRNNGLGDLVQKGSRENLNVELLIKSNSGKYEQNIHYSFGDRTESKISDCNKHIKPIPTDTINTLFIPAKEVLTAFADIRRIREQEYGVGFNDTYLDLIKSLDIPTTKGRVGNELSSVNKSLEELFEGKIEQTGKVEQPFIFKKGNQKFAIQQNGSFA